MYKLDSVVFSKCNIFAQNLRLCEPQAKQSSAISEQSVVLDCLACGSQRRSPESERRFEKNYGIEYKQILLINPISSAEYMDNIFKTQNIKTIAIYTSEAVHSNAYFTPSAHLFNKQLFIPNGTLHDVMMALDQEHFDFVINGSETSVNLADNLAKYYTPNFANNPDTSALRYNKFLMHKALEAHGLSHITQILYDMATDDLAQLPIQFPCFIKPLIAGGSIGAKKILTKSELYGYFQHSNLNVVAAKNKIYKTIDSHQKFLISEYIVGQEYFIDTFSLTKRHYVSSVQQYERKLVNNVPMALYSILCTDEKLIKKIVKYITQCLDILGIENGFAHSDLFVLPNGELKLVELNARIAGVKGASNILATLSGRHSQMDLLLNHLYHKGNNNVHVIKDQTFVRINIYNQKIFNSPKLKTFVTIKKIVQFPSHAVQKPHSQISLTDVKGFIICAHADKKLLQHEINAMLNFH